MATNNRDELVKLVLEGENLLADDLEQTIEQLDELSDEAREAKADLNKLQQNQGLIESFKKASESIESTKQELIDARLRVTEAKEALKDAGDSAGKELKEGFEKAKLEAQELNKQLTANNGTLNKSEKALKQAGISTKDIDKAQQELSDQFAETEAKLKSLNSQYDHAKNTAQEQVKNLQKETAQRRENLNSLRVEDSVRQQTAEGIEKQQSALRLIASELQNENVSRKNVNKVLSQESAARRKIIDNIDAELQKLNEEVAAREKTEASLKKYSAEFDKLTRERESGNISLREYIEAEKALIQQLDLTESAVSKVRKEVTAIAKEEVKLAKESKRTEEAFAEKARESEKAALALENYREKMEGLIRQHKEGEISLRKLNEAEKELVDTLGVTGNEYKTLRREIEAVVNEEVKQEKAAKATADAIEKERKEAERIEDALEQYRKELKKLNDQKKAGSITNADYLDQEERLRKELQLSTGQIGVARKVIEEDSKTRDSAAKSTDLLTSATRRLAQVYTVLIAAQSAVQGIAASVREYGELEGAITGVEKTTNNARLQMQALAEELEFVAERISGTATTELLRYAEVAGQMGITSEKALLDMAKAADALGVSTNLAGDVAVASLNRINSITGETEKGLNGAASAAVALGNAFALSESELVDFAVDLASGTANAKLSTDAILGLSAAIKQLGLPSERVRSTFDRTFGVIEQSIKKGGAALEDLQRITGQTADELQQNFGTRSEKILLDFVNGLKRIQDEGGIITDVMARFGITSIETNQTLTTLTTQTEQLAKALNVSSKAAEDGNAHIIEASKFWANQTSEINRTIAELKNFGAAIGENISDETQYSIDSLTYAFRENKEAIAAVAEAVVDAGVGVGEFVGSLWELGEAFSEIVSGLSLLELGVHNVRVAFNGLSLLLNTMATGVNQLSLSIAEFSGATDKELKRLQDRVNESAAAMDRDLKDIESSFKRLSGESSGAFEDLIEATKRYQGSLNLLSKEEQQAIDLIIKKLGYQQGQDELYNQLTGSITRAHRQQKVLNESNSSASERTNVLIKFMKEHKIISDELTESINKSTAASKSNADILARQAELQKSSEETYANALEAAKNAAAGQGEYEAALVKINLQITEQERNLQIAIQTGQEYSAIQRELTGLYKEQSDAQNRLNESKAVDNLTSKQLTDAAVKYSLELQKLNETFSAGELKISEYNSQKTLLQGILSRITPLLSEEQKAQLGVVEALSSLTRTQKEATLARELDTVTVNNATEKAKKFKEELKDLEKAYKAGSISIAEYNARKQGLESVLSAILPLLSEQDQIQLKLTDSLTKAGAGTETLSNQQSILASKVQVTSKNVAQLIQQYGSVEQVARATGASVSEVTAALKEQEDQLNKTKQSISLLAGAYNYLSESFDFTGRSSESLNARLSVLNNNIYENSKVTDKWWRQLAEVSNQGFEREKQIIQETLALRGYDAQLRSNNLTLAQLNQISKQVNYSFQYLDESKLTGIKSQIDAVRRSFEQLNDEAKDAAESIQDRYDELLGDSASVVRRRYEKEMEDLQRLYSEAAEIGNREAQNRLNQAMRQLETLKTTELRQLSEEKEQLKRSERDLSRYDNLEADIQKARAPEVRRPERAPSQPVGQPQQIRYIVELRAGGLSAELSADNQQSVSDLLSILDLAGQVSIQGEQ